MKTYTPEYFHKYGIPFCYFNKFLLFDLTKINITSSIYHTIYSKHFERELTNLEKQKITQLKNKSDIYLKGVNDNGNDADKQVVKNTEKAVSN
jgi:hypothetical protein